MRCGMLALVLVLSGGIGQAGFSGAALAETQTFLGAHGQWEAYRLVAGGARTCYMVSKPQESRGNVPRRGDVVAFVTHRPRENERDVVSFQAGYVYAGNAQVTATIDGGTRFELFHTRDTAWARNVEMDRELVAGMIRGVRLELRGTAESGTTTTDRFSLIGFTAAYRAISRDCNVDAISAAGETPASPR